MVGEHPRRKRVKEIIAEREKEKELRDLVRKCIRCDKITRNGFRKCCVCGIGQKLAEKENRERAEILRAMIWISKINILNDKYYKLIKNLEK